MSDLAAGAMNLQMPNTTANGGFLNMTQSMLPPIGQTTLGTFTGANAAQTNPSAFAQSKANTTATSLLDSTQMQLQYNLIGIL